MSFLKYALTSVLLVFLVACGGGGGNASGVLTSATNTSSTTTTATVPDTTSTTTVSTVSATVTVIAVGDLVVSLDKVNVTNSGSGQVTLNVNTTDAKRNALKEVPISVSIVDVSGGAIFVASSASTDAQGKFTGLISTGAVKADRVVSVIVTANQTVSKTVAFNVIGSVLRVSSVPGAPLPGTTATLSVELSDSNGTGIPSEKIAIVSTMPDLTGRTITLDRLGKGQLVYAVPTVENLYTLEASGSGVSALQAINVRSTAISPVTAPIVAASLAANPSVVGINKTGDTTNRSQLKALFSTTGNTPLKDVRVRFSILQPNLGAGEQISVGDALLFSDASGIATADYIPGTRFSSTDGVVLGISYSGADFTLGAPLDSLGNPVRTATAKLTVASSPLSLSLGDNNLLEKGVNGLTYIKRFVLLVADSAGQPVADANVSYSVDIYKYTKGFFNERYYTRPLETGETSGVSTLTVDPAPPAIPTTQTVVVSNDSFVSSGTSSFTATFAGTSQAVAVIPTRFSCLNEDANRNGRLETGEDRNGNGSLDPRKADILISSGTGVNKTDANGLLTIKVEYAQSVATWLSYKITASASVGGSEGTVSNRYTTSFVEGDDRNGSFLTPPYGSVHNCSSPN